MQYMTSLAHTSPDFGFDSFRWFGPVMMIINISVLVLYPVLLCCLAVGWMRAITRGVSYKNYCSLRDEWKLVFCCSAQMLGISLWWYILTALLGILGLASFYLLSFVLPQAFLDTAILAFSNIPSILTAFLVITLFPLVFLASSFLYFPAKANGIVISSNLGRKIFKGLSLNFVVATALALLPFGILYFISLNFLHHSIVWGIQVFGLLNAFLAVFTNFFIVFIFCGVLSGYYLWIRKHRMKSERPQTKVPDDPFSDEGWEGPMWEDVR